MSKINYNKNGNQPTEYNYSFCDDESLSNKENVCHNGNYLYNKIDHLQKIIKRQYKLQIKNNSIIKEQSLIIQKMRQSIQKIEKKGKTDNKKNRQQKSISSISKNDSISSSNFDNYFQLKGGSKTNKRYQSIASKESSKNRMKSSISTSKHVSSSGNQNSQDSISEENNIKLLQSIIQRKINIQKELKERLRNHMMIKTPTKDEPAHWIKRGVALLTQIA